MQKLLAYIEEKNEVFSQRDIFTWLRDKQVSPERRLGFAPYMAHFVFSFMDINRFILRDLENSDELQQLVNIHTNEDSHHWPWYLEDLKRMKFDKLQSFSDTLHFLWGDHCIKSRMITYEMTTIARNASPKEKVMLVEAIEKTGNVFLGCTADVCRDGGEGKNLLYYGDHHLACETGHTMGNDDIESLLHGIHLSAEELESGKKMIDIVYRLYDDFVDEMYEFVINNDHEELVNAPTYSSKIDRHMRQPPMTEKIEKLAALAEL